MLNPWPVDQPEAWRQWINAPLPHEELQALRRCVNRGPPFDHEAWQEQTAAQLVLASTFHPRGRPRKKLSPGAEPHDDTNGESGISRALFPLRLLR